MPEAVNAPVKPVKAPPVIVAVPSVILPHTAPLNVPATIPVKIVSSRITVAVSVASTAVVILVPPAISSVSPPFLQFGGPLSPVNVRMY